MEKVTIFFHGNCFDGAISAALFKNFYEQGLQREASFTFVPLSHEVGFSYDDRMFTGDVNVVLDFRYPPSDKVHWWFDHHRTTFINTADRVHLDNRENGDQFQWDPEAPSNTGMMLRIFTEQFGFELEPWHESLVAWADIIDSASFDSPDVAVELLEPAMAFTFLLDHNKDPELLTRFINEVANGATMEELALIPFWSQKLNSHRQRCWDLVEDIKGLLEVKSRVSYVALTETPVSGYNKFIPYYLAPLVNYSVALILLERGYKVSVGTNPWSPPARPIDLGKLCKQYGGGGHFSVGGIPFYADQGERAVEVANEILELLREQTATEQDDRKKEILEKSPNFDILDPK